jgi:mannose-1-phosphate guanylyltransferase
VLEPAARAGRMAVVPVDMGWSDIGSWATLTDAFESDADGNLCMGPVLTEGVKDCTIVSRNVGRKIVAAVGVDGLVIVDTPDAILICPKEKCDQVKRLVEKMKKSDEWKGLI